MECVSVYMEHYWALTKGDSALYDNIGGLWKHYTKYKKPTT